MNLIKEQFSVALDLPIYEGPVRHYVIASTPRSGSHMLGHMLKDTGCFGYPLEYLHQNHLPVWQKRFGTKTVTDTVRKIQQHRTSPNGVFGAKVHFEHLKNVGGIAGLKKLFPNAVYILLNRKNVLSQAVSYAMATQTGVWFQGVPPRPNAKIEYSEELIEAKFRNILESTNAWRYTLASQGIPYIELCYEDILQDVPGHVSLIAKFVGVELAPEKIPQKPVTEKQSDPLKGEWKKRYIKAQIDRPRPAIPIKSSPLEFLRKVKRKILKRTR